MKTKICLICHTAIDMNKEFAKFEHYKNQNEIKSKAFYHVECFRKKISGASVQEKLAKQGMELINLAKKKIGEGDEKEVVIV